MAVAVYNGELGEVEFSVFGSSWHRCERLPKFSVIFLVQRYIFDDRIFM